MNRENISEGQNEINIPNTISFEVPKDNRGRIRWAILKKNPEHLRQYILFEARKFYEEEHEINHMLLVKKGKAGLSIGIRSFYGGSYFQLRKDLNLDETKKPNDYWTPEMIRQEALNFYKQEGALTVDFLESQGRSDISNAAYKRYPGGWRKLLEDLGLEQKSKPKGYWSVELIKSQALEFYQNTGELSQGSLYTNNRADLIGAIRKYPGGLSALKKELGVVSTVKPVGYWTEEKIEQEVLEVFKKEEELSLSILNKHNLHGLRHAIRLHYPGGIQALKEKLRIALPKKDMFSSQEANEELKKLLEG